MINTQKPPGRSAIGQRSRGAAILFMLLSLACLQNTRAADAIGKPMQPLSGFSLEGSLPAIEGKVVLLDFWASWCAPCKASFPAMTELHKRFADRGLVILAVSVDDDARACARFLEKAAPPFASVRDKDHKLVASMDVPTMPTSFLIDRKGIVRFRHGGFHGNATVESYAREIEELLAEPAP